MYTKAYIRTPYVATQSRFMIAGIHYVCIVVGGKKHTTRLTYFKEPQHKSRKNKIDKENKTHTNSNQHTTIMVFMKMFTKEKYKVLRFFHTGRK